MFVDNGLLRLGEREAVVNLYKKAFPHRLARGRRRAPLFLRKLKGVADPEQKRKIIGRTFVEVFEDSLKSIGHSDFLAQGTLYPDVIESVAIGNNPAARHQEPPQRRWAAGADEAEARRAFARII